MQEIIKMVMLEKEKEFENKNTFISIYDYNKHLNSLQEKLIYFLEEYNLPIEFFVELGMFFGKNELDLKNKEIKKITINSEIEKEEYLKAIEINLRSEQNANIGAN